MCLRNMAIGTFIDVRVSRVYLLIISIISV